MPIWDDEQDLPASQPQSIAQRVRAGAALPILSNAALFDLALFGFESFRSYYAEKIGYPFTRIPGPAQLANYDRYTHRASDAECKAFYLSCLKNHIYREARAAGVDADTLAEARSQVDAVGFTAFAHLLGYPRFDQPQTHPLLVLANLPFKTYLTISPTAFVEDALRWAGKEPVTKTCRWRGPIDAPEKELWLIADDYWPSASRPLVYHLCGLDAHPQTGALFDDVVLLGFSLDSWAFRALYYGLIRQTGQEKDRRGVCSVQLPPEQRAGLEKYLQSYLDREARFDIFWGDLHQYAQELTQA